jgi:hypothetical protein
MSKVTDLGAAMIQGSVYERWQLCCSVVVYRSAYAVACCYAVLPIFLHEVILLAILNRIDANRQSGLGRPCTKLHKAERI